MELSSLRLIGPVLAIKKSKFEGVERTALDFALPDAGGGFKAVRINLDGERLKAGDNRHDPEQYGIGVEADIEVTATVNFKTGALGFKIADERAAQPATKFRPHPVSETSKADPIAAMKSSTTKSA